jgi:hypothetical protein
MHRVPLLVPALAGCSMPRQFLGLIVGTKQTTNSRVFAARLCLYRYEHLELGTIRPNETREITLGGGWNIRQFMPDCHPLVWIDDNNAVTNIRTGPLIGLAGKYARVMQINGEVDQLITIWKQPIHDVPATLGKSYNTVLAAARALTMLFC